MFNLTERLIPLVKAKPEIWNQGNINYTSKDVKLKAWNQIAAKLGLPTSHVKARWTNLRDLFRRELKKRVRRARETGDPEAYKPRWKHFRTMMFLRAQMLKDEPKEEEEEAFYPQTILEDGNDFKVDPYYSEEMSGHGSDAGGSILPVTLEPEQSHNGAELSSARNGSFTPRISFVESLPSADDGMDEDFHFLMSVLPSVRRIRRERKTTFKMRVLQLIDEEERLEASS